MNYSGSRLLAAVLAFAAAGGAHAQVVISQVYSGGGESGARFKSDYIELHNNGNTAVDLSGWTIHYAAAGEQSWGYTTLTGGIAPGGYYLIKQILTSGSEDPDMPTPDQTGWLRLPTAAGKVVLRNQSGGIGGPCPGERVDRFGYGAASDCSEGAGPAAALDGVTAAIRKDDGCADSNNSVADFSYAAPMPRNRDTPARLCPAVALPVISVEQSMQNDSFDEGNQGERSGGAVLVKLDRAPGPSGVTFRVEMRDGTATAGQDYVPRSFDVTFVGGGTQPPSVLVGPNFIGDTTPEPDETVIVSITRVSGATVGRAEGFVTLVDDDVDLTAINAIQGTGATSPLAGRTLTAKGIVTKLTADGFFMQSVPGEEDADANSSEGIFVNVGALTRNPNWLNRPVRVTGTVLEYVPADDPYQASRTQLDASKVAMHGAGGVFPPAPLTIAELGADPAQTLERYEGMLVKFNELTAVGPAELTYAPVGQGPEAWFHAVLGNTARPFREPGIQAPMPAPGGGAIPPIPRWDGNPEIIAVESSLKGGYTFFATATGARFGGMVGALDYRARRYLLWPTRSPERWISTGMYPREAVQQVDPNATLIGSYNLRGFYDNINDPDANDRVVPDYDQRLTRAARGIIQYMRMPDIVGLIEVENLAVLQALAARVNADAVRYNKPDPRYVAYLLPGNDADTLNIGYLVKTAEVLPGVPRVRVSNVTQIGKDTRWLEPGGNSALLNDRPPVVLDAVVEYADGRRFPISTVLVQQWQSDGAQNDDANGDWVRRKRQAQAEFLAGYIDRRQHDEPRTRLAVIGDFNANPFNDGYADVVNAVAGKPSADNATAVPGDGADLVNPDLIDLGGLMDASERYSVVINGNAQALDHVLVNEETVAATNDLYARYARLNADFSFVDQTVASSHTGLSDHDPIVAFLVPREAADLRISASANNASVQVGQSYGYSVTARNLGPARADAAGVGFALDAEVPSLSVTTVSAGWSCDAPQIANGKTSVACASTQLLANDSADFTVSATASAELSGKSVKLAVAANAQSYDPDSGNDTADATVAILPPPGPAATAIGNGEISLLSDPADEGRVYRIDVPSGARN